jgi:hypothetical protein
MSDGWLEAIELDDELWQDEDDESRQDEDDESRPDEDDELWPDEDDESWPDEDGYLEEAFDWPDGAPDLTELLREALHEDYAEAPAEQLEEALADMFDSMSLAESFNFAKALRQIQSGASRALADPQVAAILRTGAPVVGAAAGTLVGGPAGTALGGALGNAAAKALPAKAGGPRPAPPTTTTTPQAGGSTSAAKGFVLTQQPDVLKSILAAALGAHGRQTVNGVPVGAVMNMLSSLFAQAAEDADALMDDEGWSEEDITPYLYAGPASAGDRADALYENLLASENDRLTEAIGWEDGV